MTAQEHPPRRRYLLGQVTDEERESIERRLFEDDQFFDEISRLEDDLVEDYVRGALPQSDREAFEHRLASSPEWQARVAFATALGGHLRAAQAARRAPPAASETPPGVRAPTPSRPSRAGYLLVAASAAAIVVCGWLAVDAVRLHSHLTALQTERSQLEQRQQELSTQTAQLQARNDALSDTVARLQTEVGRLSGASSAGSSGARTPDAVVAIALRYGAQRDASPGAAGPARVALPPATDLRLQLDLPPQATPGAYRAVVRTAEFQEIWSEDLSSSSTPASPAVIALRLPSRVVARGDYVVFVSARDAAGRLQDVASYRFTVVRR